MYSKRDVQGMARRLQWVLVAFLALWLVACGGDGTPTSASGQGTGSVGIVLTDAPASEFSAINMTVTKILLLSDDEGKGPVTLFEGKETIDLLSLRDYAKLFSLSEVPAGSYGKIRLILNRPDGLELVMANGDRHHPKLPGNGKIDLNPKGDFEVVADKTLYIQIDVDAEKSIHAHTTGNGKFQFRPVVFVDVINDEFRGKLVRKTGYVRNLMDDGSRFALCDRPLTDLSETLRDDDGECLVIYTGNASLFGEDGLPAMGDSLADGANITAIGFLRPGVELMHDDEDEYNEEYEEDYEEGYKEENDHEYEHDEDSHHAALYAEVIELLDGNGNFETLEGVVASETQHALDSFVLNLQDRLSIEALLQEGTKVFGRDGVRLAYTDIKSGTLASVDGVRVQMGENESLRTSLVVLDSAAVASLDKLAGVVKSSDADVQALIVATASGDELVQLTNDTVILIVREGGDGSFSDSADFSALSADARVELYGEASAYGYFVAKVILILG